jgi:hypothetical protein
VLAQLEGKDYLEDALIVAPALTTFPPSKERDYGADFLSKFTDKTEFE